ncbi:hypothetical protein [Nocardioides mesophilus]|uniref:Uncharacterized protein n=1 Tax=Nocardioides mesophilus TaxID=433659 RepID=A0A7G9RF46_9ACTN|nr:hypothetical protein [Nocardioides mesophilus]QNN54221.1 hypothetical protein H9L09_07705 [Nocardioides mesophilus]
MKMSEIAAAGFQPFWSAEIQYRQERARRDYHQRPLGPRGRRHWLPRRPGLKLPGQRRRPLAVA